MPHPLSLCSSNRDIPAILFLHLFSEFAVRKICGERTFTGTFIVLCLLFLLQNSVHSCRCSNVEIAKHRLKRYEEKDNVGANGLSLKYIC